MYPSLETLTDSQIQTAIEVAEMAWEEFTENGGTMLAKHFSKELAALEAEWQRRYPDSLT